MLAELKADPKVKTLEIRQNYNLTNQATVYQESNATDFGICVCCVRAHYLSHTRTHAHNTQANATTWLICRGGASRRPATAAATQVDRDEIITHSAPF